MVAPSENDIQNYFRTFPFFLLFSANSKFFHICKNNISQYIMYEKEAGLLLYFLFSNTAPYQTAIKRELPWRKTSSILHKECLHSPTIVTTDEMTLAEYFQNTYSPCLLSKLSFHMLTLISECNTRSSGIQ